MTTIDNFLSNVVPDTIKQLGNEYVYAVIGSRAIQAYLPPNLRQKLTSDWDLMIIGNEQDQEDFTNEIKKILRSKKYKISTEKHEPIEGITNLKSNSWYTLSVRIGDPKDHTDVKFLDIYRISDFSAGIGTFTEMDGIIYNDLGFLVRELLRREEDTQKIIEKGKKIDNEKLTKLLEQTDEQLQNVIFTLDVVEEEGNDIIFHEEIINSNKLKQMIKDYKEEIKEAEISLKKIIEQRQLLFGAVAGGNASKSVVEQVCNICKNLEQQLNRYIDLENQCDDIKMLCS